jgi:hypothetical protein
MSAHPRRLFPLTGKWACLSLLLLVLFTGILPALAAVTQEPDSSASKPHLHFCRWRGGGPGIDSEGSLCWLRGPDDSLRLEIGVGSMAEMPLTSLLNQDGEGFTVVQARDLTGTRNAWAEAWDTLGLGEGIWVRLVLDTLEGRPLAPALVGAGVVPLTGGSGQVSARPAA